MAGKGYVVRGLYKGRHVGISDLHGSSAGPREPHPFATLDYAAERAIELRRFDWSDVAIFRVLDDGREDRLPSYEEALGEIERLKDRSRMVRDVDEALHAAGIEARHGEKLGERAARAAMHRCEGPCCNKPAAGVTCSEECAANLSAWLNRGDPLAALESAERRLLEAGGYQPEPNESAWWRSRSGVLTARDEAVSIVRHEFQIERRRLAAKGGA